MKKAKKALAAGLIGLLAYPATLLGMSACSSLINEPVKSYEHLLEMVEEEKVGIDEDIFVFYSPRGRDITTKRDGKYIMVIDMIGADRGDVKHELYHIKAGHVDKVMGMGKLEANAKYWLWYEPSAIFHELLP